MTENTINDGATMGGGATGTMLVNRYRVVRQLGQGGMGSVWLAEDTQLDNRQVAIKMLPSILVSNKRAYNQLKSEALVSLKLTHPNIAAVRAFEENNGNPFLVVDYIDGQTLDDYLLEKCDAGRARAPREPQSAGLPESEVIRLLTPIAAALDYAHGEGVVHRDVKPGNVMIRKDGHPFILDFGIAREIQETLTRVTGKLSSGTLMYMSPEQLNGEAPSAAQDVYSFAAMAYECLTGAPPFARGNIEYQIMNKEPAPLDPSLAACVPGIMSGLAKKPEDRPGSCVDVLAYASEVPETPEPDVGDGSEPSGVGAPPPPSSPRRWLGVVAVVAVAVVGFAWWRNVAGRAEAKRIADARFVAQTETQEREKEKSEVRMRDLAEKLERERAARKKAESNLAEAERERENNEKLLDAERERKRRAEAALAEKAAADAARMVSEASKQPSAGDVKTVTLPGGAKLELVWCPPGSVMMGSPAGEEGHDDDETQHRVTLTKGFWIGKYEVTQRQWQSVMGSNPSYFEGENRPVEKVSWEDCQEFCRKAGLDLRLPTEAEWVYACRAGTTTAFSFGSVLNGNRANCNGNYPYGTTAKGRYREETSAVGAYEPNAWGLYDMHGNVWEWCADWYGAYGGAATDPTGPSSGEWRVNRGGGWNDSARSCRSASRGGNGPGLRCSILGFRVCCSAGPSE